MTQTADQVATQFSCVAKVGIEGCGLEEPLESIWKALAPAGGDSSKSYNHFVAGSGHGTKENSGFLRPDAVLAIISVSDEEDCSVTANGRQLLDMNATNSEISKIGFNYRCAHFANRPEWIQPVSRYHDGLVSLKPGNPERIIFAGIVGVPEPIAEESFDTILKDPAMQSSAVDADALFMSGAQTPVQPTNPKAYPKPACVSAGGSASPGYRTVELAKMFGTNGVIRSICASDYSSALNVVIAKIAQQLTGACLPRALAPNSEGLVECDVVELLRVGDQNCDAKRGRILHPVTPTRINKQGKEVTVCKVNQVAIVDEMYHANPSPLPGVSDPKVGWYYDDFTAATDKCPVGQQQRIAFYPEDKAKLADGATASIECFSAVGGSVKSFGKEAVGSICAAEKDCKARSEMEPGYQLGCEAGTKTCQIKCTGAQDCPESWVCAPLSNAPDTYCIDATCPPVESTGSGTAM